MNDLGLNLDGPKPLKGVLNVLGSAAVTPHGGQQFATVLENSVQSDLSQVEAALENREPVLTQPAAKFTWTPPIDEIEVPGTIAHHPVDPITDAAILPDPSMPSMETPATSDAVQPILQEQPAKLLDLAETPEVELTITPQPKATANLHIAPIAEDNPKLKTETDADINLGTPATQPQYNSEPNPTEQLDAMRLEPEGNAALVESSPTIETPVATPHILDIPAYIQDPKQPLTLPYDATKNDSKVMAKPDTIPNIMAETDPDLKVPEAVKPPQMQMKEVVEAAPSRVNPDAKLDITNKPMTPESGRPETVIPPVKHLTNTNTLKQKNNSSTQSVKTAQPLHTAPIRSEAIPDARSENGAIDAAAAPANLASKETKNGERQVFSLRIDSEPKDTRGSVRSEAHIQPKSAPANLASKEVKNGERQVFSLKIQSEPKDTRSSVRSEAHIQTDSALKLEQNPNSTTPTRVDSQPPGATPTPITFESLGDRNMSQNIKELATQTGGERLQTFASALVLNTRDVQWGQRLVAQIEKLSSNGEGKLELSLRPKNLGDMHISLEFKGDEAQVRIVTETSAASRVLIGAEDRLAQMLDAAGFKLSSLSASSEGGLGQGLGQHTRQKQQSTPGGTKNRDTETGADSKRTGESHNGTVNVIA
ncbi:flagellar hook-length control protein FliK [Planktomarina temperata]|uniref:Flagellar hook-length control protein FliK n=1 Tax=Planktomarina temperata RCA23 TaxID=666509 RepID=A0AAN0RHL6_9RHOB|nr:putative flagellar hook-length control protein FliK [Planktomarina temperata RCA23]